MKPYVLLLACLVTVTACQSAVSRAQATLANPASVNCTDYHGQLVIRVTSAGEKGFCILPDGRALEEWEFYHQTHP